MMDGFILFNALNHNDFCFKPTLSILVYWKILNGDIIGNIAQELDKLFFYALLFVNIKESQKGHRD